MHGPIRSVGPALAVALLGLPLAASGQAVQYAYDAAGRLSVVADPRGDLAVYDYDAVGNLLSIRRIGVADVADAVVIVHVAPEVASRGATVSIFGKGFGATADANALTFNGAPAAVLTASATRLTARVPANATTGPIRLGTPLGVATSRTFRVLGALSVTPPSAVIAPRGSIRFFAASSDSAGGVRWSVDRVPGGDAQRGTITTDGLYVAPDTLPLAGVRVMATSLLDPALEATAHVTMITSRPLFVAADPLVVDVVATNTAFAIAAPLAVRVAPVILSLTPSAAAPGETIRLVITGAGFDNATRLELVAPTGPDATLIVSDLTISADGSEAAAEIAVPLSASLGPRVVRIVTPAGSSGDAVAGENVFTVR
jgi:IPT/TIG domain-containing protein/RHS repeat protein